jgi:hypothetical protein
MIDSLMIVFFFLGHSNMSGFGARMDTVIHPRVYSYTESKGFFNCTDNDLPSHTSYHSGSMVIPFLKRIALFYPNYKFCAIKYGHSCGQAAHIINESQHRGFIEKKIEVMKSRAIIGGLVLDYGFIEGQSEAAIKNLPNEIVKLASWFRSKCENSNLPIFFCRYEINGILKGIEQYRKYDPLMIETTEKLQDVICNLYLTPFRYVPKEHYSDNHHYNENGYEIIGSVTADIIQEKKLDFWYRE